MTLFEMYIIVSSNKFWTGMISPAPAEIRIKIFKILKRIKILEILECMNIMKSFRARCRFGCFQKQNE